MAYGCKCGCSSFREHVGTGPYISGSATPTRSGVALKEQTEKQWAKDGDAYKALKREGLQPRNIDGSAELAARATTNIEIERGQLAGKSANRWERVAKEVREEASSS